MSNIVKWKPTPAPTEVERRIDYALAELRAQRLARLPQSPPSVPHAAAKVVAITSGQHARYLELLRICCIRGETYVSRYMHKGGGRYDYASSAPITKPHFRLIYAGGVDTAGAVPSDDIDEETCPYCHVSGEPIFCGKCKNETCSGSVVLNHHSCFCGHEGELTRHGRQFPGFRPKDWK